MKKQFYVINELKDRAEILIYTVIGTSYWGEERISALNFIAQFKELKKKYNTFRIRINTPGGSVWDGIPIYNYIQSEVREGTIVELVNDGIAYSMGGYLMLSGTTNKAYRNSVFMFHCAIGGVVGNKNDLKSSTRELEIFEENLATIMAERTGKTKDEILTEYFDGTDHFLSAQEAYDLGLITEIIDADSTAKVPKDVRNMQMSEVFAFYESKNLFPTTVDKLKEGITNLFETNKNQHTQPDMNKETHVALNVLLGLEYDADDKLTINGVKDIIGKHKTVNEQFETEKKLRETADASVTALQKQVTDKDTEIANLKEELAKDPAERTTVIDSTDKTIKNEKNKVALDPINEYAKNLIRK